MTSAARRAVIEADATRNNAIVAAMGNATLRATDSEMGNATSNAMRRAIRAAAMGVARTARDATENSAPRLRHLPMASATHNRQPARVMDAARNPNGDASVDHAPRKMHKCKPRMR